MNGAERFVSVLRETGVKNLFGIMGDMESILAGPLSDAGIDFIVTRHEQAGAFMADAIGRVTGEPAVCYSTLGPGATNLVTGVANANLDRSPLVAVSSQLPLVDIPSESHQYLDLEQIFEAVSKDSRLVRSPTEVQYSIESAFFKAREERPGAVHVSLPLDVLEGNATRQRAFARAKAALSNPPLKPVLSRLRGAKSPVFIVGNLVARQNATIELKALIKKVGAYVLSTFQGKGCYPESDSQFLGVLSRHQPGMSRIFDESDIVVNIGFDTVEGVSPTIWGRGKHVIHIDSVPNNDKRYKPETEVVVPDLRRYLGLLTDAWNSPRKEVRRMHYASAPSRPTITQIPIQAREAIAALQSVLDDDTVITSDVGIHKQYLGLYLKAKKTHQVIFSNGLSSMGFGLPAALGVKFACPEKKVISFCGDGGFLMNVQELETAQRRRLPVTVVIMNDHGFGMLRWKQRALYGRTYATDLGNPDYALLAESFGAAGHRVQRPSDLVSLLEDGVESNTLNIIDVPVVYGRRFD